MEPGRTPATNDIAFVQFTSGSTATPKGVVITHRNLRRTSPPSAARTASTPRPTMSPSAGCRSITTWAWSASRSARMYSAAAAVIMTPACLRQAAGRVAPRDLAVSAARSASRRTSRTTCAVRRVKDADLAGLDLSSLARRRLRRRADSRARRWPRSPTSFAPADSDDTSFHPSYGLAEIVLAATLSPPGRRLRVERLLADDLTVRRVATRANGTARKPCRWSPAARRCPATTCASSARTAATLPERQIGEIVSERALRDARATTMMPTLTAQTIRNGWLYTGDLGYLSDGELFVCGRVKDLIIVNGRKYHPQDLEWAVDRSGGHPARARRRLRHDGGETGPIAWSSSSSRAARCRQSADRRDSAAHRRCLRPVRGRRRARAERHGSADDERQSAARGDEGAVRARRARYGHGRSRRACTRDRAAHETCSTS